tara:strand:+ start:2589 stop:4280 length:1692 start_codon:yes stop_codon:yes gene_type:complete
MNANQLLAHYEQVADAPDAIPRLRRFILDLAVRGKLVAQDPNDEPASELLKRIAAEKARLVEAGSFGRTKAAAPTTIDEDVELPLGWAAVYGFDLFPTRSGNSKLVKGRQHSEMADGLYPGFSAAGQDVWLDRWEHEGDAIILSAVGARCGKGFRASGKWSAIANTHIIWLLTSITDPAFAMLHLNNEDFWLRSGGAQPFVKVKATLERPFPLPPLAEQRLIVAKVEELTALLDRLEAARSSREDTRDRLTAASLARLTAPDPAPVSLQEHAAFALDNLIPLTTRPDQIKALRQTIHNLAVRGKLVEQDPADEHASELLKRLCVAQKHAFAEEGLRRRKSVDRVKREALPFEFPSIWELPSFDDLFVIVSGVTKGGRVPADTAVELPYLRVANVQRGHLDLTVMKKIVVRKSDQERYQLRSGDILMTEGGDWDKLGRAAIWRNEIADCIHQNHIFRVRPPSSEILPDWVVVYVNSELGRRFFENASKQTTNLASINMTQLRSCPLPLPPLAEQHRIVAKVDALMALCDRLEAALATADTTRQRLLEALLHEALMPGEDREEAA